MRTAGGEGFLARAVSGMEAPPSQDPGQGNRTLEGSGITYSLELIIPKWVGLFHISAFVQI